MDTPLLLPISRIQAENAEVKTLFFRHILNSQPGQFVMLWVPGIDQKPFSVAYDSPEEFGVSVFPVGPLSKALCDLKPGDRVGVTGPYGTGFSVEKRHYITVGGGYGAGPLAVLAERVAAKGGTLDFCLGARTKDLLLFAKRAERISGVTVHLATNDGSHGHRGYVTDILERLLEKQSSEQILVATCGPELMEKKVLALCNQYNVACEISIERYMKCGFGVCGQCAVDSHGIRLCTEGPVVTKDTANQIKEFGEYHRDKSGQRVLFT